MLKIGNQPICCTKFTLLRLRLIALLDSESQVCGVECLHANNDLTQNPARQSLGINLAQGWADGLS